MTKILWLAHEGNLSGANICLLEYIDILNNKDVISYLVVPVKGPMSVSAASRVSEVAWLKFYTWIWPVGSPSPSLQHRLRRYIRNRKAVKELTLLIKKHNPDFVVTNTVTTPVAAIAAKKTGKKHIWFVHEFGEEDHGYTMAGSFTKAAGIMNRLSYKIVFNSKAVQHKYEAFVPINKRCIVHNATPASSGVVKGLPEEILKIIMLGRVHDSKNQLEAIKAIKLCVEKGLDVQLNIVGKAEDEDYVNILNNYVKENNLASIVNFLGATDKPDEMLLQNEILLMCSRMEAFGRVTVEALKHGLPVIAANTGGSVEIINVYENGLLYKEGDPADLADKIQIYYNNRHMFNTKQIALNANSTFNFSNTQKQLLEVFN